MFDMLNKILRAVALDTTLDIRIKRRWLHNYWPPEPPHAYGHEGHIRPRVRGC
jgi:hypothetical protein